MTAILAEKPKVAQTIARTLHASERHDGYVCNDKYMITWALGHLLTIEPKDLEPTWTKEGLPAHPRRFTINIPKVKLKNGTVVNNPDYEKQLFAIKGVFDRCDDLIIATDAGREGELIAREVMLFLKFAKPFKRLWISSLTEAGIREGFLRLKDGHQFDTLFQAALARTKADFLVGINGTRALSLYGTSDAVRKRVLSLGRVQTPTLGMICGRFLENKNFVSTPFWLLEGETSKDGKPFPFRSSARFTVHDEVEEAYGRVLKTKTLTVSNVERDRKEESPSLPLDLDELQIRASKKYKYTATETAETAQELYESGFITYPRTSSRYITQDLFEEMPRFIATLRDHPLYGAAARALEGADLNRQCVDDKKVTDHYAFLVTENAPSALDERKQHIYDLIACAMLEAMSPACVVDVAKVTMTSGDIEFVANGRQIVVPGWRGVTKEYENVPDPDSIEEMEITCENLPALETGDVLQVDKIQIRKSETRPKPLLTDGTLVAMMKKCSSDSQIADKTAKKMLKDVGIGTPATRAAIIETLVRRLYVARTKGRLLPTELGLEVYGKVKDLSICNVEMTGVWESRLAEIEGGNLTSETFLDGIYGYCDTLVGEVAGMDLSNCGTAADAAEASVSIKCPKCGKLMHFFPKGLGCSDRECNYVIWRKKGDKDLTDNQLATLVTKGKTGVLKGFKNKEGKTFDAALALKEDGSLEYLFDDGSEGCVCPRCGKQQMRLFEKGLFCPDRECDFVIWRKVGSRQLTDAQLRALATKGITGVIKDFWNKDHTKQFDAKLVLSPPPELKVSYSFDGVPRREHGGTGSGGGSSAGKGTGKSAGADAPKRKSFFD